MSNVIYVAVTKDSGDIMTGNHGQHAYGSIATLRRSIGQAYKTTASYRNVKPMELYNIIEIDVDSLPQKEESYYDL